MTDKRQPNILIICTDQQRADTIAALGNDIIKTPAIDSIVRSGTSFLRGYTPAPICSPARIAMVTGRPPHEHRFTDHDWYHWEPEEGPASPAPHDPAFMEDCKTAGYQTFWSGKIHHSGRPWLFEGVDEYAGDGREPVSKRTQLLPTYRDYLRDKGYPEWLPPSAGMGSEHYMTPQTTPAPPEDCRPHWLADQCVDFLHRRDSSKPFLMHLHFVEPHPPVCNPMPWGLLYRAWQVKPPHRPENHTDYQARTNRYQLRYKCKETAQQDDIGYRVFKAAYYGNISFVDQQIGRVLEALGDQRDNTLILFIADHGEMLGDYGCVGKRCMLEGSIRIPFIAAWPGRIPAGKQCRTPVSLLDLHPTILEAIGAEPQPRSPEGRSLLATAAEPDSDRIVFSQFSSGWCGQYAATDGRWKYMYSAPDDTEWLFEVRDELIEGPDRIDDPAAAEHRDRLKAALMARHDPSVDPFSDAVEDGDWKKHTPPPEEYLHSPAYGFLWQERGPEKLQAAVNALGPGYARDVIQPKGIPTLHGDHSVCRGVSPFEREDQ
jgi:choline-sulfatase